MSRGWLRGVRSHLVALLCGVVFLAGCAGPTTPNSPSPAPTAGGFPLTITHQYGTTTINAKPIRIVSLASNANSVATALSAQLVAISKNVSTKDGRDPWLPADANAAAVQIKTYDPLDMEQIAALKPDLILFTEVQGRQGEDEYRQLSRIAPTLARDPSGEEAATLLSLGRALGNEQAVQSQLDASAAAIAKAKEKYRSIAGRKVAYGLVSDNKIGIQVDPEVAPSVALLQAIGLQVAPELLDLYRSKDNLRGPGGTAAFSWENYSLLNTSDLILLGTYGDDIEKRFTPIASKVPAAKRGNLHYLPYELINGIQVSGPYNTEWLLEGLAPSLDRLAANP